MAKKCTECGSKNGKPMHDLTNDEQAKLQAMNEFWDSNIGFDSILCLDCGNCIEMASDPNGLL